MQKKILMTASVWQHVQHFHLPYLRKFQNLGWETCVGCSGIPDKTPFIDKAIDLPFKKKMYSPDNFRAMRMIKDYVRKEQFDLIITHTTLAAFFTRLAVKGMKNRPRLVNVMHGYLFDEGSSMLRHKLLLSCEKFTAPETDLLLTMNKWDFECAIKNRLGKQILKIPGMGVDFSRLERTTKTDGRSIRKSLGIPDDGFVLIYPAEFSKRKNQCFLIEAMQQMPRNVWLVLCGTGELLKYCMKLAEELHVKDRILFPGYVSEISMWYQMADAAVSSSRSEGLPFNIIEAMYMGLPVIASTVKGHTDLIQDGINGLLYSYDDLENFTICVHTLFRSSEIRERLGKEANRSVKQYELSLVLPKVTDYYLDLPQSCSC